MYMSFFEKVYIEKTEKHGHEVGRGMSALRMLRKGLSVADAAECADLSEKDVETLAEDFADFVHSAPSRRECTYLLDKEEKIDLYISVAAEIAEKRAEKSTEYRVKCEIARNLLAEKLPVSLVAKCSGLDEKKVGKMLCPDE